MTTTNLADLDSRLWAAADELRANSSLSPTEYRGPVLGLIFLAFAEHRFDQLRPELETKATERRPVSAEDFRARGVLYVPDIARLSWLVDLPEGEDLGANVDLAMDAIEKINAGLRDLEDGEIRDVDIEPLLSEPIFAALRDRDEFSSVRVDEQTGAVAWPNGADLDPDVIYGIAPAAHQPAARVTKPCR